MTSGFSFRKIRVLYKSLGGLEKSNFLFFFREKNSCFNGENPIKIQKEKRIMKTFFKDLWITEKETMEFYKRHPLGTIIFTIVSGVIGFAVPFIMSKIQERKMERIH